MKSLLTLFARGVHTVFTSAVPSLAVAEDPDDTKFIERAAIHRSEGMISGDRPWTP